MTDLSEVTLREVCLLELLEEEQKLALKARDAQWRKAIKRAVDSEKCLWGLSATCGCRDCAPIRKLIAEKAKV